MKQREQDVLLSQKARPVAGNDRTLFGLVMRKNGLMIGPVPK